MNFYSLIYRTILNDIKWVNNYEFFTLLSNILIKSTNKCLLKPNTFNTLLIKPAIGVSSGLNLKWKQIPLFTNLSNRRLDTKNINTNYLFSLYLKFANGDGTDFKIHTDYRYMFMYNETSIISPYVSIDRFHKKWIHSYNLLINLFFAETQLFAFASKLLREEALAFNWSFGLLPYTLFKQASPYFFLKDCNHGSVSPRMYRLLSQHGLNVAFVADTKYQKRTLFYLRINKVHTIGLVPYTISPWIVNYALPAASSTLFTQYFFLKLLTYVRQQAECYRFNNLKSIWYLK